MKSAQKAWRCKAAISIGFVATFMGVACNAATFLEIDAEPGEFLFAGTDITATDAEGDLSLHYSAPNQLSGGFTWNDAGYNIQLTFYSGAERSMEVGSYMNAVGLGWREGQLEPSIDIHLLGAGRSCGDVGGEFHVYEFEPTATPARYAINFTQYCVDGGQEKIYGILRINSDFPRQDINPIATIALPAKAAIEGRQYTLYGTDSRAQEGDIVGYSWSQLSGPEVDFQSTTSDTVVVTLPTDLPLGGAEIELGLTVTDTAGNQSTTTAKVDVASKSDPQSFFRIVSGTNFPTAPEGWPINIDQNNLLTLSGGLHGISMEARETSASFSDYSVSMYPPEGQDLKVGLYQNATRFADVFAGLDYSAGSHGCNEAFGSFEVLEMQSDDNELTRFHARYTHYCESLAATPTSGEIGFNVLDPNVPTINVDAPIDVVAGETVTLDASGSVDTIGEIETYQWTGPSDISLQNSNSAVATFVAPQIAGTTAATKTFDLLVTDNEGYQAKKTVTVTISPAPESESEPEPKPEPEPQISSSDGGGGASGVLSLVFLSLSVIFGWRRKSVSQKRLTTPE